MTTDHVVRHGEVHNPAKILYGRLPGYHLSDLGREMAEVVRPKRHEAEHHQVERRDDPNDPRPGQRRQATAQRQRGAMPCAPERKGPVGAMP